MACCKCGHIRDVDGLELGEWSVAWRGQKVPTPPREHVALKLLTIEPGKLIHWSFIGSYDNSRMIISRLRAAFQAVDPTFDRIETIRGRGFRWIV
jgi:DNA-binding response OmpR family regulator